MKTILLPLTGVAFLGFIAFSALNSDVNAQEAKPAPAAAGPKWEYRALRIDDRQRSGGREAELRARRSSSQDTLNQLGNEGWELVAVRNDAGANNNSVFYFKRPKR